MSSTFLITKKNPTGVVGLKGNQLRLGNVRIVALDTIHRCTVSPTDSSLKDEVSRIRTYVSGRHTHQRLRPN